MTGRNERVSTALVETVAGLSAGTASTLATHPLDVIKTRLQVQRSSPDGASNSLAVLRSLLQGGHPLQSVYRGLTPNLIGNATSWALFFYFKSRIESQLRSIRTTTADNPQDSKRGRQHALTPADYFTSSLISGVLITLATNPIWVLKTRMLATNRSAEGAYPSMWAGAKSVWRLEGPRGFYKGVGAGMLSVSHGAVQFAVYDPLKGAWARYVQGRQPGRSSDGKPKMSNTATLVISGASKIIAGTVTYPLQVLRSRMQTVDADTRFGKGIRGVVKRIAKEEGWKGFYRGIGPNVIRVLPATWVTFLVYENVRFYLPRWMT